MRTPRVRRSLARVLWLRWPLQAAIWGTLACAVGLLVLTWDMPSPDAALQQTRRPSTTLVAADGALLATSGDLYGERVRLADLPAYVPEALLSVEDRRFRSHWGVDPIGLLRAAYSNLVAGHVVQGGSTLTQQLAKNLFLTPQRNLRRKVQEALLALWLEHRFTKNQLLEIYLNRVYLGSGAYGVDAAARLYFGVPASRLNLWQAAMLMGLPRAPSRFNPRANPQAAVERTVEVLNAMVANGVISSSQASAEAEQIRIPRPPNSGAGWFSDWVQDDLATQFPPNADLHLRATLDSRLQALAEARLRAVLDGPGARAGVTQGAIVAMDAGTGAVLAMVGGHDYGSSPFNRATSAWRQPGSSFKPLFYLLALEKGATPDDMVADTPLRMGAWSPGNEDWQPRGEITLRTALAHSINTSAVRVLMRAGGPGAAIAEARKLGLTGKLPDNGSIALGTGSVTLLEMVDAYAAIANGGFHVEPFGIAAATSSGRALAVPHTPPERVATAAATAALRRMLVAVVTEGTGRAAAVPGLLVGGKTGTTQEFRDAWFVGFSGRLVLGVWLGNDDGKPMRRVFGGGLPAQLFHEVLAGWAPARVTPGVTGGVASAAGDDNVE